MERGSQLVNDGLASAVISQNQPWLMLLSSALFGELPTLSYEPAPALEVPSAVVMLISWALLLFQAAACEQFGGVVHRGFKGSFKQGWGSFQEVCRASGTPLQRVGD